MEVPAMASTGQLVGAPSDVKNLIETIMWPLSVLSKVTNWEAAKNFHIALSELVKSDAFLKAVSELIDLFKKNPNAISQTPQFVAEVPQSFMGSAVFGDIARWCGDNGQLLSAIPSWMMMLFSMIDWKKVLELLTQFFDKSPAPTPTPTPLPPPAIDPVLPPV